MGEPEMAEVDRVTDRVLVQIRHMPLSAYIERFADAARHEHVCSPTTAPDTCEAAPHTCEAPGLQAYVFTLMEQR
jgi:hypothetical protein